MICLIQPVSCRVEWKITSELLFGGPISAATRSKAYVCSNLITRFVGWNPSEGTDVRLLCLLCVM